MEGERRKPGKKLRKPVGPFKTVETVFSAGKNREVEVTLLAHGIELRLKGDKNTFILPYGTAYTKAASISAGASIGPRQL